MNLVGGDKPADVYSGIAARLTFSLFSVVSSPSLFVINLSIFYVAM